MPELNVDEYLILKVLEDLYRKNRNAFSNDEREWAPGKFEPLNRHQWMTERELSDLIGPKLSSQQFHDAVFAVCDTLNAAERRKFSGIDPCLRTGPFAYQLSSNGQIERLDELGKVVDRVRPGNDGSPVVLHSHERIRIVSKGLQFLREFEQSPEGRSLLNATKAAETTARPGTGNVADKSKTGGRKSPEDVDSALVGFLNLHHGYETGRLANTDAATWAALADGSGLADSTLSNALRRAFAAFEGDPMEKYRKACEGSGRGIALFLLKANGDQRPPKTSAITGDVMDNSDAAQ